LLSAEAEAATLQIAVKEAELKRAVTEVYYTFLYLKEKEKLLLQSDTIHLVFLEKAKLRLQKGESNLLEKTSAEAHHNNLLLQLQEVQQAQQLLLLQFQLLLNSENRFSPQKREFRRTLVKKEDFLLEKNPKLMILEQQQQINKATIEVTKTKLLPEFSVGYSNITMLGTGANEVVYNGITRFHSAQIGVNVPLFKGAHKAKIEAEKQYLKVSENVFLTAKKQLENDNQTAFLQYENAQKNILFLEQKALPNVFLIEKIATQQLQNGEINYLEWAMLMQQNLATKMSYIEAIKASNESIILINFLNNQ
jgi:heavy metal efflux system protein